MIEAALDLLHAVLSRPEAMLFIVSLVALSVVGLSLYALIIMLKAVRNG
jgi:hypothetical protein